MMDGFAPTFGARLRARRLSRPSPLGLRILVAAAAIACVLAAGFMWLRDSSLVRVREVFVSGVSSSQEAHVRQALQTAALDMTTLHVREDALRRAVQAYASVADLRVDAEFPHKLSIEVVERTPAALAIAGGERVPVTAGGVLLRGVRPDAGLPVVRLDRVPTGTRIAERDALAAVAVVGAAPPALRARVARVRSGGRGLVLDLRNGPDLVFGSATRVRAKWAAAARVMADSDAAGATYLDVRVPEWTAAGGRGPIEDDGPAVPGPTDPTMPDPTAPATPQP